MLGTVPLLKSRAAREVLSCWIIVYSRAPVTNPRHHFSIATSVTSTLSRPSIQFELSGPAANVAPFFVWTRQPVAATKKPQRNTADKSVFPKGLAISAYHVSIKSLWYVVLQSGMFKTQLTDHETGEIPCKSDSAQPW